MKADEPAYPTARRADARIVAWMADYGPDCLRIALGIVFLWFGILKYFPDLGMAERLAARTFEVLTAGHMTSATSLPLLATWECAIGLGLLTGRLMRTTLFLLFAQMIGTMMPLILFPAETWRHPFVPTLAGHYIIKNIVLISAGILLGAMVRGGKVIADPKAAQAADQMKDE
ncbi:hypothetical protein ACAW74_17560 [Fibrella sp. WM1]|uniref:DoxX-like family protein n=1 Tax=Fibrella musci TaxID=3242485 RepID=UPI003521A14E